MPYPQLLVVAVRTRETGVRGVCAPSSDVHRGRQCERVWCWWKYRRARQGDRGGCAHSGGRRVFFPSLIRGLFATIVRGARRGVARTLKEKNLWAGLF